MDVKSLVKHILTEQQNKRYVRALAAKTVSYDDWIRQQEQQAAERMEGRTVPLRDDEEDFVLFRVPDGRLAQNCRKRIAEKLTLNPEAVILYGDEDVWENGNSYGNEGCRKAPWFKPAWSPDLFKNSFYFGGLVVMRRSFWKQMRGERDLSELGLIEIVLTVGEYSIVDPVAFQRFVEACVRSAGGYKRKSRAVLHVPEILFHSAVEIKEERYRRWDAVDTEEQCSELLSIIIPSKDNPEILEKCLRAIPAAVGKLDYEIIVVDNGSSEENKQRIQSLVTQSSKEDNAIRYLYRPMEFHFSKMCNLGAEASVGSLLLFLNDDVELFQADSLEKMALLAQQEYTGAVGMKLYYPASIRLQHAGITNLPMGPVHKLQFLEDNISYYFDSNRGCRNVLAVTAACLMVEKTKYIQVGGFPEALRVAFNDVDFCFSLYEQGYINVCRNDCAAYHHESLSRGDDESSEKLERLLAERDILYQRHPGLEGVDPYYGAGLGREGLDTGIRPAYETAGNLPQEVDMTPKTLTLTDYRQDNCLLVRVEEARDGRLQGYAVVLGDNNACYEWRLLLQEVSSKKTGSSLWLETEGQYRPDLEQNMPDQTNVGLCGFWLHFNKDALPKGQYRIGMAVRNRVTGLRLMNWSNRRLEIK